MGETGGHNIQAGNIHSEPFLLKKKSPLGLHYTTYAAHLQKLHSYKIKSVSYTHLTLPTNAEV